MEVLKIVILSFGAMALMFILTKILGNRQMSQLSMFDYITGITIGSIAAEMATSLEEFYKPLIAMIVVGLLSELISFVTCKSMTLRKFFEGKPMVLFENGKLYKKNLASAKFDVNEFLMQCRGQGYFDLANIQSAILESNGKISILPQTLQRPLTPSDMNLNPTEEAPVANVIIDGRIMTENLRHTGNNEIWLQNQLHGFDVKDVSEVFLATCDINNKLNVYVKINEKMKRDIFM